MGKEAPEVAYWVALNRIVGVGRARFQLLEQHFGTMEAAWNAAKSELQEAGLDARTSQAIVDARATKTPAAEVGALERHGIAALTWNDPDYPARLREIYELPPVLYVKGAWRPDEWNIAVVGTRRPSPYGRQAAEVLSADLARNGVTVVSGLARGIDAVAHRAALTSGGRTIAVCASGLDIVYPPEHARLASEIVDQGALVSDYPPGTEPRPDYFPRRNRIMSGISLGVLIVEAGAGSGALHTANWALEQGREIFAIPGSIFSPMSQATNSLIREGAKLVAGVEDILEELNLTVAARQPEVEEVLPSDDTEAAIVRQLSLDPKHIDEIRRDSGLPIAEVSSALALLELKGMVRQVGGMTYVRTAQPAVRMTRK
jgi:DNA processing protein